MKKFIADLKKYYSFAWFSAKTDLKAEVANSYLNWIWWVLQPLMNMCVYTLVFKKVFGNDDPYFPVFIFSGLVMWEFFTKTISYSVVLVRLNREIITKVYVPKFILLLGSMMVNIFKMFLGFLVMIPLILYFKVPINWSVLQLVPVVIVYILFTFSCSCILLHFGVFVDDLSYIVGILLNVLMFISGIFYDIETGLPKMFSQIVGACNPIAILINQMRCALFDNNVVAWDKLLFWTGCSIILVFSGIKLIYKYENSYTKVI